MSENDPIKHTLQNDYALIPMSEITDEARTIAVLWCESKDQNAWIGDKHKLASDIMNYARRFKEGKIN